MPEFCRVTGGKEERIITPESCPSIFAKELWQYRELFFFLAWRDLTVRYRQTLIGAAWAIIRPVVTMIVFTMVFGAVAGLASPYGPYPLMVFCGVLPWQLFSSIVSGGGGSVIGNAHLVTKVYFPRIILVGSSVLVNLADFFFSFLVLLAVCFWYGVFPTLKWLALPLLVFQACVFSLGLAIWLGALTVRFRDFSHLTPFFLQILMYLSPVGFSSHLVPEKWRLLYAVNPLVGVIDGFRWSLLGGNPEFYVPGFLISIVLTCGLFFGGVWYFSRVERDFADII